MIALLIFTLLMAALAARAFLLRLIGIVYVPMRIVSLMALIVTLIVWLRVLGVGACGRDQGSSCDDTVWIYIAMVAAMATTIMLYGLIREIVRNVRKETVTRNSARGTNNARGR